ncbi:MAG: hypothetical protein H0W02_18820 [Ktedonobacteraceae bacterium]|nr:hypothetical protein [Ktedonobacteraceae bacterium]
MILTPTLYRDDMPPSWQDEQSGRLVEAVSAYLERKPLTAEQFALIRMYLVYSIHAPCWNRGGPQETVNCLKPLAPQKRQPTWTPGYRTAWPSALIRWKSRHDPGNDMQHVL